MPDESADSKLWTLAKSGAIRNVLLLVVLLLMGGKRIVEVWEHPPATDARLDKMSAANTTSEKALAQILKSISRQDTVDRFGLCFRAKTQRLGRDGAIAECAESYPTMRAFVELGGP